MRKIVFFIFLVSQFLNSTAFCQLAGLNQPFLDRYQEQLPYFQELITGGQYAEPSRLIEGDPYRYSRQFENGGLTINRVFYPEVPLLYDCFRDQVVTFHPIFNQKILIKPEKIESFTLANGEQYRYFGGNSAYIHDQNGIYQVIHEGEVFALSKRYKTTKEIRDLSKFDQIYVEKTDFFLWEKGQFYSVSRPKDAFNALEIEPKSVKKQLKSAGVNFRQAPEAYLKKLLELHSTF